MTRYGKGSRPRHARYHVRTRSSLVDEYIRTLEHENRNAARRGEGLRRALDRMHRDGWSLVAAAGEALLFRARHV